MFSSPWVARLSISHNGVVSGSYFFLQTARGYSLSIFFSILMVYALIHFLESGLFWGWALLLMVCGFLITYTIPSNPLFIFALGTWVGFVTTSTEYLKEFDLDPNLKRKSFIYIFYLCFNGDIVANCLSSCIRGYVGNCRKSLFEDDALAFANRFADSFLS